MKKRVMISAENNNAWSVSDFVAVFNQTIDFAYPSVAIVGEISNYKVSKGKWVYFDLKDDFASIRCFGSVFQLPGPLEDGMLVLLTGNPRLHESFGFSVTFRTILPTGEGALKKASNLLFRKLSTEGLFNEDRKRVIPYAPKKVGLITSKESAAFKDFTKIMNERWSGVQVELYDVQVQGEAAIAQIITAIQYFNSHADPVEVIVVTRGGGSMDDLAVFSTEQVTRSVAASRIPTVVAIGHEIDESLAEMASDLRASTPSNAAQLLFPDRQEHLNRLEMIKTKMRNDIFMAHKNTTDMLLQASEHLDEAIQRLFQDYRHELQKSQKIVSILNPENALTRGYSIVRKDKRVVNSTSLLKKGDSIQIQLADGEIVAKVDERVQ